jgi:hypothetical protein
MFRNIQAHAATGSLVIIALNFSAKSPLSRRRGNQLARNAGYEMRRVSAPLSCSDMSVIGS